MSEKEINDLSDIDIDCCEYHNEICKKAPKYINELQQEIKQLKEERKAMAKDNALKRKEKDLYKRVIAKLRRRIEEYMQLDTDCLLYTFEFDERKELLEILNEIEGGNNE